jgi:hypothetical protein
MQWIDVDSKKMDTGRAAPHPCPRGADETLGEVIQRRAKRIVEDDSPQDPVVLHQPGIVDLMRRRHVVGDHDDRRQLMNPLADFVSTLQLIEKVGHRQLVVGILDLVERGRIDLCALRGLDLHPLLFSILSRALLHAFAHLALGIRRIGTVAFATVRGGADRHAVAAIGPTGAPVEMIFVLRLPYDLRIGARGFIRLVSASPHVVFEFLHGAALLRDRARGVPANLLRRERDRVHQVANLVRLRLPSLAVGHQDAEVDRVLREHVERVAFGEQLFQLAQQLIEPARAFGLR